MSDGDVALHDSEARDFRVLKSTQRMHGAIFDVRSDRVQLPDRSIVERDYIEHPGAVAVAAIDDDAENIVLIRQYRHPVRRFMWELPAGLRDVAGEDLLTTAERELAEEVDLTARKYTVLLDLASSAGFSDELVRVYLARGLRQIPEEKRSVREAEEATLQIVRTPLKEAVRMVYAGEIENATAVAGVLAVAVKKAQGDL